MALESENKILKEQVARQCKNDPEKLEEISEAESPDFKEVHPPQKNSIQHLVFFFLKTDREAEIALLAANRWTDNVWALRQYCIDKMHCEPKTFDEAAGEVFEDYVV